MLFLQRSIQLHVSAAETRNKNALSRLIPDTGGVVIKNWCRLRGVGGCTLPFND